MEVRKKTNMPLKIDFPRLAFPRGKQTSDRISLSIRCVTGVNGLFTLVYLFPRYKSNGREIPSAYIPEGAKS